MSALVHLIGRFTRTPELKYTQNGKAVTNFSLAVDRDRKREGEPDVDFYRVTAWGKQAENIAEYCKQGQEVSMSGTLHLNPYTRKDMVEVISPDVTAEHVKFLAKARERQPGQEHDSPTIDPEDFKDDGLPF